MRYRVWWKHNCLEAQSEEYTYDTMAEAEGKLLDLATVYIHYGGVTSGMIEKIRVD